MVTLPAARLQRESRIAASFSALCDTRGRRELIASTLRHHSRVFRARPNRRHHTARRRNASYIRISRRAFSLASEGCKRPPRYSLVGRVRPGPCGTGELYRADTQRFARVSSTASHDGSSSVALAAAYHSLLAVADFVLSAQMLGLHVSVRKTHTSHRTELRQAGGGCFHQRL